jgi:Putative adhesin
MARAEKPGQRQERKQKQQLRLVFGIVATGAIAAIFLISSVAHASDRQGQLTEEFHKVYPLSAQGRVEIENLNGPVHITGWDRDEIKVDAVKSAWTKEHLDEVTIEIHADQNHIAIHTEYPRHDHTFNFGNGNNDDKERNNPASVEYTITVPRQARLDEIKLVNGRLDVQDVTGEVHASCVNGRIQARNLKGPVELNTVNGELDASLDQLPSSEIKLSSVNGKLRVTLPSDAKAELKASTVSGNISDDFGLPVTQHQFVGRSLHGQLAEGGTLVKLSNVNGTIEIRHARDNRPLSPAQNLEHDRGNKGDSDDDEI